MRSVAIALCCVLGAGVSVAAQRDVRPTAKPAAVAAPTGKGTDVSVLVVSDDQLDEAVAALHVEFEPPLIATEVGARAIVASRW